MRTRTRLFATALATLTLVVALGAGGPAAASGESPSVTHRLLATVGDLLDVATYEVHTRFTNADGTTTDRSTPAVVGVPELVNVNRGLPDLAVTVTPLADRLRLSIDKLPTASASLPVLVEAVFDLPGGLDGPERGVAFGYDQTTSTAPRGFTADLLFSVFDPPRDEFTLVVSPRGAPASLAVVGSLFTRSDGTRLDPKAGRLVLEPVPDRVRFDAEITSRPAQELPPVTAKDSARVTVRPSAPVRATVTASDTRGDFSREVVTTVDRLPSSLSLGFSDETLAETPTRDQHQRVVDYTASSRIGQVDVSVTEKTGEVVDRTITGVVRNLPTAFTATLDSDDVHDPEGADDPGVEPVETQVVTYGAAQSVESLSLTLDEHEEGVLAKQALARATGLPTGFVLTQKRFGVDDEATEADERTLHLDYRASGGSLASLEAGVATDRPVAFLDDPASFFAPGEIPEGTVPAYAFNDGDDLAVRLLGLSEATVDTGEPLLVHAVGAAGPFLVRKVDPDRSVTAQVLNLPATATLTYASETQNVTFTGSDPIGELRAAVDSESGLSDGPITKARFRALGVPSDLTLTVDAGPRGYPGQPRARAAGEAETLASFDARGQRVGLLELLLTSGPEPELRADADGVVLRDLGEEFSLFGRITGLSRASATRLDDQGDISTTRIARFETGAELVAPLEEGDEQAFELDLARLDPGQAGEEDDTVERNVLTIEDRPNSVIRLDVAEERVATANLDARTNGTPRARIINYEADRESGELRVCRRSGPTLPDFDCAALVHGPQPAQRNELGLTASVDHLPTRLDVCLAADQGKFGRDGIVERVTCPGVAVPGGLAAEARLCNDFPLDCRGEQLLTSTVIGLNASSEVRINLFECTQVNVLAPSGLPVCVESAALDDFRLTRMHVQIDAPKALDTGYVYLDTGNNPVTGKLTVIPNVAGKTDTEVRGNFVNLADDEKAFKADDRLVVAAVEIVGEDGALDPRHSVGSCQFAPGSDLEVRVGLLPAVEVINEICDKAE